MGIPEGWRVCGENMFALHSIYYEDLPSYFIGFSIWDENNVALSWDDTLEWFELIGIVPARVLYDGIYDEGKLRQLAKDMDASKQEGFVGRLADPIPYRDFRRSVAKYVRPHHVQTDSHWMHGGVTRNKLAEGSSMSFGPR